MITSKIAQIASLMSSPELLQAQKQSQQADIAFGAFLSQTSGGGDREFFWRSRTKNGKICGSRTEFL